MAASITTGKSSGLRTGSSDLQWDGYGKRMLRNLHLMQENDLMCDLTLTSEGTSVRVHRTVMAAASDYFKALLTLDMKERGQKTITLKGVPGRALREIVRFAYTGKLRCTLDTISDLLLAATHLQVTEAVDLCSRFLMSLTNTVNSVDMYHLGEQFNLPALRNKGLNMILDHFEDIAMKQDYLNFSEKFLAEILEENRLKMVSELRLFELVLCWVNHNPTDRSRYLFYLMSRVRFPLIPPQDLVECVMNEPLMKSDPQCLDLILEANKYHMLPDRQPLMQTLRSQVRSDTPSLIVLDIDDCGPRVFDLSTRCWASLHMPAHVVETCHARVTTMGGYMYVCGGIEVLSTNNPMSPKCYRYDPRFDTWTVICPLQHARHNFTLVSDGHSLFAVGGFSSGVHTDTVEEYTLRHDRWTNRAPVPIRVSSAASACHDGALFLSGGHNDGGISRLLHCYNVRSASWKECAPMLYPRVDHTMACHGNTLWVLGGYNKNIVKAVDVCKVESYDIETNQWSVVGDNTPKISAVTSCQHSNLVYIVGGFSYDENKKRSEVWCYNTDTSEWCVVTRLPCPAMSVPCCALYLPRHMLRDFSV